jgi:molybdenum cofactor cytidylyltransferase
MISSGGANLPCVAALILAAGRSTRLAPANKLLLRDRTGMPMIAQVVTHVLRSRARPALVVLGWQEAEVRAALSGCSVRFVVADDYALGLSASLRAGMRALPADIDAALICLGDMPLVTEHTLDRLCDAYAPTPGRRIVVPTHAGRLGNPVLWDRGFFTEILALQGDHGARTLFARYQAEICHVPVADDSVLRDFDTAESLAAPGAAWTDGRLPR